jgi:NAD(P) transhydrogenase subunit alpha
MIIGVLKEKSDSRVTIVPDTVRALIGEGIEVHVETTAGENALFFDADYVEAGAVISDRFSVLSSAHLISTIEPLDREDYSTRPEHSISISFFQPFVSTDFVQSIAQKQITIFSLDMIPRITLAQMMDFLSSMASIAGYKAVVEAANLLPRYFPMLTTAAGSIPPAKVLVLGAGVAGLQAIATAKRLGAVVEAFDTRLAAKEEVESLGAKFVEVEGARDDKSAGGYAIEQTDEYKAKQKALIFEKVTKADAVITTAQLRGKKAPVLITADMVNAMKAGSVIVDLASSTGGNCELTQDKKTIIHHQVTILGNSDLAAEVPQHASQLFSRNLQNFMKVIIKNGEPQLDFENPIIKSSCVVYQGEVVYGK